MLRNFPLPKDLVAPDTGLKLLLQMTAMRSDVKVNAVHISLNFSPDEVIPDDKMKAITGEYMDRIGLGDQPYLVFRHHDSGHPHCHIVTTNICLDGSRISLHNLGKMKSEPARKALENEYGLVKAEQQRKQLFSLKPVDARKVQYGQSETKKAIAAVLAHVLDSYRFTSLPELNAVLGLYNVSAERGSEDSRIYKHGGLVFRVLDNQGMPVGVPVKASHFYNKPTLASLESRFIRNGVTRQQYKEKLRSGIEFIMKSKDPQNMQELSEALDKAAIRVVLRHNAEGLLYGMTYIDMKTKCVFNGSSLGKSYSAKGMQERFTHADSGLLPRAIRPALSAGSAVNRPPEHNNLPAGSNRSDASSLSLFEQLMQPEFASQAVPGDWKRKKKRKKRRRF